VVVQVADALSGLLEFSWRDISFPTTEFSVSLQHDTATHAPWRKQGENIESTGRKSLVFRASIPFYNNLLQGKSETWTNLYPDRYRKFLNACADIQLGYVEHPELGRWKCKPITCETSWDASRRGGCMVTAEWRESVDLNEDSASALVESPLREADLAAANLDKAIEVPTSPSRLTGEAFIREQAPGFPKRQTSFQDVVNAIGSVGDQSKLFAARQAGMVGRIDYAAKQILRSVDVANDPLLHDVKRQAIRVRNSAADLKRTIESLNGASLVIYSVQRTVTLVGLAQAIGVPLGNVLPFNPALAAKPVVRAGTVIKFKRDVQAA
jgi:hypothetical protein